MSTDAYRDRIAALREIYGAKLTDPDLAFLSQVETQAPSTPKDRAILAKMEEQAALGADAYAISGRHYDAADMADLVFEQARHFHDKPARSPVDRAALRTFREIARRLDRGQRISAEQTVALELIVGHHANDREAELVTV